MRPQLASMQGIVQHEEYARKLAKEIRLLRDAATAAIQSLRSFDSGVADHHKRALDAIEREVWGDY